MQAGFYLGFIVLGSPEWPKATSFLGGSGGMHPRKFFEMNAIWCILRPNFQKCYSGIFSRDHLLTMLHLAPIFFVGKLGILRGEASIPQIP